MASRNQIIVALGLGCTLVVFGIARLPSRHGSHDFSTSLTAGRPPETATAQPPRQPERGAQEVTASASRELTAVTSERERVPEEPAEMAEPELKLAAERATRLTDPTLREQACEEVAVAWANADLPGAVQWLNTLRDEPSHQAAALAVAYEAARFEPVTALKVVAVLAPSAARDQALVHALSQWAAADEIAAMNWARQVPEAGLRQRLLATVAVALAEVDGQSAATMAATSLSPGPEQSRAAVAIVQRWARSSPDLAATWVSQFPPGHDRATAMEALAVAAAERN